MVADRSHSPASSPSFSGEAVVRAHAIFRPRKGADVTRRHRNRPARPRYAPTVYPAQRRPRFQEVEP